MTSSFVSFIVNSHMMRISETLAMRDPVDKAFCSLFFFRTYGALGGSSVLDEITYSSQSNFLFAVCICLIRLFVFLFFCLLLSMYVCACEDMYYMYVSVLAWVAFWGARTQPVTRSSQSAEAGTWSSSCCSTPVRTGSSSRISCRGTPEWPKTPPPFRILKTEAREMESTRDNTQSMQCKKQRKKDTRVSDMFTQCGSTESQNTV